MSYYSIGVIPREADLPEVRGHFHETTGIPALRLDANVTVQFQSQELEFAVRYLTKLADEAQKLAQQITEAHS